MHILLVGSRGRSHEIAVMLKQADHAYQVTPCPVFDVAYTPLITLPTQSQALIITSALAVENIPHTALPVYCVGSKTAQACKARGLNVAAVGDGNLQKLFDEHLAAASHRFLCVIGYDGINKAALHQQAAKYQQNIDIIESYKHIPTGLLERETDHRLQKGPAYDAGVFMSAKGAGWFIKRAPEDCWQNLHSIVVWSEAVAKILKPLLPQSTAVFICPSPNRESMLTCLKQIEEKYDAKRNR